MIATILTYVLSMLAGAVFGIALSCCIIASKESEGKYANEETDKGTETNDI